MQGRMQVALAVPHVRKVKNMGQMFLQGNGSASYVRRLCMTKQKTS